MQARMKKYPLSENQNTALLNSEQVGRLATMGQDGYPYVTPVHYVYWNEKIYIHGLVSGEKLSNIKVNGHVCFEVERMLSLLHDASPCDTNTHYESVIIRAKASAVEDSALKAAVLSRIVEKYTPQHQGKTFPDRMLAMTAVIELHVTSCTGKYYPGSL